ncbi:MAG: GNAT family N-acetyltransferase [Christensenellales bacterium]|jgi:hypothetical protein
MWLIKFLDTASKYIGTFLFWSTMITLLVFLRNYYSAIYGYLKKFGIKRLSALSVAIICRKDFATNSRIFMEYCIFQTEGRKKTTKEWINIIRSFKSKYILHKKDAIDIENTFVLTNADIKAAIQEYFIYLNKKRNIKYFSIDNIDCLSFVLKLRIKQGYIVPLVPINSLQQRYNEDWSKILSKYVGTFSKPDNAKLLPMELYSFYTWLMWGPSVQLDCREGEYKLLEYGLGDESMSVPMILTDSETDSGLWNKLLNKCESDELGMFISSTCKLYYTRSFVDKNLEKFGLQGAMFISKMSDDNPFLLSLESYSANQKMEESNYLFSAYIWIMLNYYDKNAGVKKFNPDNTAVWFEHANIADSENVKFLKAKLMDKIITHLENVLSQEKYDDRIYQLCWALNKNFLNDFVDRVNALIDDPKYKFRKQFQERLILSNKQSLSTLINSIDYDFGESGITVRYTDIDFNDSSHLGLLGRFYCELYCDEFPDDNERESLNNILRQAKRFQGNKKASYHLIIARKGEKIVGGIIGDYFLEINSGVIEFVVVSRDERGNNIGTGLKNQLFESMNARARKFKRDSIDYCFFEVEDPEKISDKDTAEAAQKRLGFWAKMLAKKIDIDYVQPALEEKKNNVDYLMLATIESENHLNPDIIDSETVLGFIRNYFNLAMNIENPAQIAEYKRITASIHDKYIPLKSIN